MINLPPDVGDSSVLLSDMLALKHKACLHRGEGDVNQSAGPLAFTYK